MKKNYTYYFLLVIFTFIANLCHSQSWTFQSHVTVDINSSGNQNYDLQPGSYTDFNNENLGTFGQSNTLILNGAEIKTWQCGSHNIIDSWLRYRIYLTTDTPPIFLTSEIFHLSDDVTNSRCSGTSDDKTWSTSNAGINVLNALTSGTYYLEVYTQARVDTNGDNIADISNNENNGNSFYKATFIVDDPPIAVCQDITVQLDVSGTATIVATDVDGGSSDDNGIVSRSIDIDSFDCSDIGSPVTVILTVEDSLGQTDTCTATVTVEDTTNPTASNLAPVNVQCTANVPAVNIADVNDEADNCGVPTVAHVSDVSDGNFNPEVITRTYSVTDASGNSINVTQTITVEDTTNPTASNLASVNVQCTANVPAVNIADVNDEADNCAGAITVAHVSDVSDGNFNPEVITRTYSVTDASGNSINVTQLITIEDTTNPTASNLAPVNVQCAANVPAVNIADVNDEADNCAGAITVAHVSDVSDGNFNPEVITRTYSVTDASGNSINVTQTITVEDTTNPTASNLAPVNIQCAANVPAVNIADVNDEADNCAGAITVAHVSDVSDGNFNPEVITRTYSVTDASGNSINVTQLITIEDTTNPTASNLAPVNVQCAANVPAVNIADVNDEADNCAGAITVAHVSDVSDGNFNPEVITRTYSVTDASGNSINVTQLITIEDTTNPTASNLAPVNVQCAANVPAVNIADVTTEADNCGVPTVAHVSDVSDGNFNPEVITRTYSVTDASGNSINVTQTITVEDTTNPTASNLAPVNVQCAANVPAVNIADVNDEADNCAGAITVAHVSDVSDGNFNPEVITRTYSVTDASGNSINVTQLITIEDTTNPTASNLAPVNVQCAANVPAVNIADVNDEADNCAGAITVAHVSDVSDGNFNPEVITRTYSVTDASGNSINVTQTITVEDTTNPIAICQNITVALNPSTGLATITPAQINNGSSDNCGTTNLSLDISSFNCGDIGTNTVTLTVNDGNGNSDSCTATVTVTDNSSSASVSISTSSDINNICVSAPVTFTATPGGTYGSPMYQWQVNGTDVPGETASTFTTSTLANNDTVRVVMTSNLFACGVVSNSFTVTVNPTVTPTVTIQVNTNTVCQGEQVTFSEDIIFNGGVSPSYDWWLNGASTGVTTPTYTITPNNGDSVYLIITPSAEVQCPSPPTAQSNTININVNPLPIVDAGSDQAICVGQQVTLSGSGAVSYAWDNGVTNGVAFTPAATTTYTVTGTDANGCQNTDTVTVTVNPLPNVDAGSDQAICVGQQVTLSGSGAVSYAWDNGVTNGVAFTPAATTTYTVTGTDANGCQNTDTVTVTVNPLPNVDAGSDQAICVGQQVTLSGSGAVSYTWDNGVTNGVAFTPAATTTYTVTGTDANGCQNTDTVTVTVNPLPNVDAGSDQAICVGQQVTLSGSGAVSYTWDNGVTNGVAFTPAATTTYTVTGTDANGCQNTDTVTVTVNPLPNINAGPDQTICAGDSVTLSGSGGVSYSWDNGVTNGVAFTPAATTTYTVTGTDANGCQNTDTVTITVNPLLTPSISISATTTQICTGTNVTFTATPTNGGTSPSYQWYVGATPVGTNSTTYSTTSLTNGQSVTVVMTPGSNICVNASSATSNAIPISVYTTPATPGAISGSFSICPVVTGLIYSVPNNPNIVTYNWSLPIGFNITSGAGTNQITVTATASAANGNIVVTGTNPCGTSASSTEAITVGTFAAANAGPDQTVCTGTTQVTLAGTVGGAINRHAQWDWEVLGGAGGSFSNPNRLDTNYIFPAGFTSTSNYGFGPGVIRIRIYTIDPAGSCTAAEDFMDIRMLPNPTASILGSATICSGNSSNITFTATPNTTVTYNINGGSSQTINVGGSGTAVLNSGAISSTRTYNLVGVGYTASPACTQTASGSATITVTPIPTATINYAQPFCQSVSSAQSVTLNGTGAYTGGNYTSSPAGLSINASSGAITPSASTAGTYTVTYTIPASGGCGTETATTSVTITAVPTATISYAGTPFCRSLTSAQAVTLNGTGAYTGGTYSAPAGLTINSSTGAITPSTSTAGTYTVTYTIPASSGCGTEITTTSVTITAVPTATISYAQPFCRSETNPQSVTLNGTGAYTGGTYSSSPAGLSINASSGAITPSASTAGTYTVTYTIPASGGCGTETATTSVTITAVPTATISYAGTPYCQSLTSAQAVTLNGTGAYTGGSFTASPAGLALNASTGAITPSTSTAGTYTVTYTIPASGGCGTEITTTSVTITAVPTATISYAQPFCRSETNPQSVTLNGTGAYTGGTYSSSPAGLSINSSSGAITPSASTAGTYTVTYTIPASGGCGTETATTSVAIKRPVIITTQPQNVGVCVTEPASLSVVAVGDDLTYQWYKGSSPSGVPVSGATSNVLNFAMTAVSDSGTYYVVVSGNSSCASVTSTNVSLNVNQVINITDQPDSATLCEGSNVTFTVAATGSIASYQWRFNGSNIGGANSSSYTITNITPANAGNYDVVISSPGGTCSNVYSTVATLTVTEIPTATISYATPFCSDISTPQAVTLTGTHAYTGGTYSASPAGLTINSSTGAITPSTSTAGTYTITYTIPASGGCGTETATTNVTITPLPIANISYSDNAYCESDSNTYNVTLTGSNNGGGTYSASPAGLTINSSTGTITPETSSVGNYTVTYTIPASTGCGAVTATFNIEIESEPDATFSYASSVYCNAGTDPTPTVTQSGGTFSSSPAGLVINSSTGVIDVSASTVGTYTVYYTFAAVSGGCAQVQSSQSIDIVPDLSNSLLDGFALDDQGNAGDISSQILACHEGNGTLTLHIDPTYIPYIVEWQYNDNGAGFVTLPSDGDPDNNVLTHNFTGLIGTTGYRVVFNTGGTCGNAGYSTVAYVSVIPPDLKPEPVTALPTEFCFGGSSTMTASTNYGAEQLNSGGLFQTGQINTQDPNGWLVDGAVRGLSAANNNVKNNNWSGTNPHTVSVGGYNVTWNSGQPKFAIALGVLNQNQSNDPYYYEGGVAMTTLTTPIFSLMTLQDAIFTFDEAFVLSGPQSCIGPGGGTINYPAGQAIIQISTNGGSTWANIPDNQITDTSWRTGAVVTGSNSPVVSSGNLTNFNVNTTTVDLSSYFGNTQMRIRFVLVRNCESVWALDNIELPGATGGSTIEWTDQFNYVISYDNTIIHTPITPGYQIFTVTTYINGCRSLEPDGSEDVPLTVDMAYAGVDQSISGCGISAQLHAYDNTKKARVNAVELQVSGNWIPNLYTIPSPGFDYDGTGATGEWSITSGPAIAGINWATENPANYFFPSVTDPRAEFAAPGGAYTLTWTVHGVGGDCSDSVNINLTSCATLDFDGIDDNVTFRNDYNLNSGPFSIEVWVKPDPTTNSGGANNAIQTILSKRDANSLSSGYDLRLENNKIYFYWNNGNSFTHSNNISTNRWYHVAVTYDGANNYKMYIDGIELGSTTGPPPTSNTFECIMGAMDRVAAGGNPTPINYYSGWLDELRIWSIQLSVNQIRHMMNQEIMDNGGNVRGAVVPIDIPGPPAALTWANLRGYYRMNQATDIANGYVLANAGTRDGQMRNITTWQLENSPMPYESTRNGNWYDTSPATPWVWGNSVWDYPNALGIDGTTRIDWNIVRTSHNVESDLTSASPRDITLLGLIVNPTSNLTITAQGVQDETNTGHGLWVTHYLKLDGFMNLIGESQLVQKRYGTYFDDGNPGNDPDFITNQVNESILDVTSSGYLKRDQQGTNNLFNYNYWSSPVGPINVTSNNLPFSLTGNVRDGTISSTPQVITWNNTYNATGTVPINLSRRWIYTFSNKVANTYSQWDFIGQTGTIAAGLGYTMKGSGVGHVPNTIGFQNYSFIGKPYSATYTNLVNAGNEILVGNPYSSALDAHAFINENGPSGTNSINGTLYFWDHYQSSNTHILAAYEGGYAQRNLSGGNAAVTPPVTVDGFYVAGGTGTKIPGRYVPVAQGFFVTASASGGLVTFNNSQRVFQRETNDNSNYGSSFFRYNDGGSSKEKSKTSNTDNIKRLRLEFTSPDKSIRPLLLAFVPDGLATDGVDYGFDAQNYDVFPSDLSWRINDQNYVIQGVGDFDKTKQYPLSMLLSKNGTIEIALTDLENFDKPVNVFIYDTLLGTYTRINNSKFEMSLDANNYQNRFFLAFQPSNGTLSIEDKESQNIIVNYLSSTNEIYVKTINHIDIKQIYLINMIGQTVKSWNVTNLPMSNNEIRIPVSNISEGNYILKVETNGNTVNKKIIISN